MAAKSNIEHRKITDFLPDPSNANKGTERGLKALDDSLAEVGLGRSIVADKNGYIIGGNKTQERAVDQGFDEAIVVHTDGKQLVIVQRDDLDLLSHKDTKARKLAYYDNRAGELGLEWDAEQLLADVDAGLDLATLFRGDELDALLEELDIAGQVGDALDGSASTQRKLGDKAKQVKPVLYLDELHIFERALQTTGEVNRGQALMVICKAYLGET